MTLIVASDGEDHDMFRPDPDKPTPSIEQMLAFLNDKYRFVDINMSNPAWSEVDENGYERTHTQVLVHLSNIGWSAEDPYYMFDDLTVTHAVTLVYSKEK